MSEFQKPTRRVALKGLGFAGVAAAAPSLAFAADGDYTQPEIIGAANRFFGAGAHGVADAVARIFRDNGRPVGYIQGQEEAAAAGVGVRYGEGRLHLLHRPAATRVFWQGPSIGFDAGGNASKSFTLVYGMRSSDQIYRRFPGVEGSAYFIGGVGVNYQRAEHNTLAPMRLGVGL